MAALEGDHGNSQQRERRTDLLRELREIDGFLYPERIRSKGDYDPLRELVGSAFKLPDSPSHEANLAPKAPFSPSIIHQTLPERDTSPQLLRWLQDEEEKPPLGMVRRAQPNQLAKRQPLVSALTSSDGTDDFNSMEGCTAEYWPEAALSPPTENNIPHKLPIIEYHESHSGRDAVSRITHAIRCLKDTEDTNSGAEVKILMHWELPYCLSKFYPCGVRLGDVMTVTGNSNKAYATSCREYVGRSFPGVPERLLLALETFLDGVGRDLSQSASGQFADKDENMLSMDPNVSVSYDHTMKHTPPHHSLYKSIITFTVAASSEICVQIACFLSWLYAATRYSQQQGICHSELNWKIDDSVLNIERAPLTLVQHKTCWHHLFSNTVIATQFIIPQRFQGQGLEIRLSEMLSLSRSLRMLELHQCFVAEASQNLLIVMAELSDDGGYQWHLEEKRCPKSREGKTKKLTTAEILSRPKFQSCLKGVDIDTLKDARHFLGWTPSAEVVLATSVRKPSDFTLSGAQGPVHTRTRIDAYNLGIGFSHWGGASLGVTATTSSIATRYARQAEKDLQDTLQDLEHESIVVFDYSNKIAWRLPTLSVLLYMIQLLCAYRGFCAYDKTDDSATQVAIPIACREADGGKAALKAINESLHLKLQRQAKNTSFWELAEAVCLSLEIGQQLANDAWDSAIKHQRAAPKCIVGFELMELVKENTMLQVKEELVNQPWAHLAQDGGLVLFGRDIGQAIAPSPKVALCNVWQQAPPGMHYFVAHGFGLQTLLENLDHSRLSDRVEWDFNQPARHDESCTVDTCSCPVLQILRPVGHRVAQPDLYDRLSQFRHGAFIFHHSTSRIRSSLSAVRQFCRDLSGTVGDNAIRPRPHVRSGHEQKVDHSKLEIASPDHSNQIDEASEDGVEGLTDQASQPSSEMSPLPVHGRADPNAADTIDCFDGSQHPAGSPVERGRYRPMTPGTGHIPLELSTDVDAAPKAADGRHERNSTAANGFRQPRRDKGTEALRRIAEPEPDITLDTDQGLVLRPSDVQAVSKGAGKKVKRHATATNRLHQGRRKKETKTSINIAQLDQQQIYEKAACRRLDPRNASDQVSYTAAPLEEPLPERNPPIRRSTQTPPPQVCSHEAREVFPKETLLQRKSSPEEEETNADTAVNATETSSDRAHFLRHAKRLPRPELLESGR